MKNFIGMIALLIMVALLTACGSKDGEKVYVLNWGDYIDPDVIDLFEKETGIKVVYDDFQQNEEMYPKIQAGAINYDVVCPSDYMIQKMIENDLLQEINFDNIPNFKYIDSVHLESAEEFDPGNKYSVPYTWGTLGILYNKTKVEGPVDSWDILFDEKYAGEILMIDSVRDAFAIALVSLGYDLNSTNEAELEEAKALLKKQYPLVQAYVVDQVRDKMIGEEAAVGVIYSGEAIFTQRENPDLEYVVPKEGSNVWIDGWVIPKNSKNKENAEAFINFLCDPKIALMNFEFITYSTPNYGAWELIEDQDVKNSPVAFPPNEIIERCTAFKYLGEDMERNYMYKWNEAKGK